MNEDKRILKDGKALYKLANSEGWELARNILMDKMVDLQSVANVEGKTPEEVFNDVKVRRNVAEIMVEWIRDIEGRAEQYESSVSKKKEDDDDVVMRL